MCKSGLLVFCILMLGSCTSPEKLICRTWKVDKVDFNAPKSDFEAKIQQSIKEMIPSLTFTFKPDSTYTGGKADAPLTGIWYFTNKKKGIIMTSSDQQTNGKIVTLTKKSFVIDNTGPQGNEIKFTFSPVATTPK